ncbi:MAG: esterase/lipase family protein [Gemmatimonadota bacterium]
MFVHGNLNDACNWKTIADYLNNEGWSGDELWAITFREGTSDHGEMRRQLDDFVQNVMNQTGKSKVHVVAHSLGVTGVRFWMDRRDRYSGLARPASSSPSSVSRCAATRCTRSTCPTRRPPATSTTR